MCLTLQNVQRTFSKGISWHIFNFFLRGLTLFFFSLLWLLVICGTLKIVVTDVKGENNIEAVVIKFSLPL